MSRPALSLVPPTRAYALASAQAVTVPAAQTFDAVLAALDAADDPNVCIRAARCAAALEEARARHNDRRALELQVQTHPEQWGIA
jgi:hypothetical protein